VPNFEDTAKRKGNQEGRDETKMEEIGRKTERK
jgi:hypothetical protein